MDSRWWGDLLSPGGLTALAGLWLIVAPFALAYDGSDPYWSNIAAGTVVAATGFIRLAGAIRSHALTAIDAATAAWLLVSAVLLDHSHQAMTNDLVMTTLLVGLSLASAATSDLDD
jgi:hypothetical protein